MPTGLPRSAAVFKWLSEADPSHHTQSDFDVTCLEKTWRPLYEIGSHSHNQRAAGLQNTGAYSNQHWREKILRRGSEEVCVILIGPKKKVTYLSASEFEGGENFGAWLLSHSAVRGGQTASKRPRTLGEKSMAGSSPSLISTLTRTHLERLSHLHCHSPKHVMWQVWRAHENFISSIICRRSATIKLRLNHTPR